MKVVIVGATGALGRALAIEEASRKSDLQLIASDLRDLEALQRDLELRYLVRVEILQIDLRERAVSPKLQLDADRYYFPAGLSTEVDELGGTPEAGQAIVDINFLSEASLIAQIFSLKTKVNVEIVGFGSIAETRGRSRNIFYSASKRALTSFYESLLHASMQSETEQILRPYLFQIGYMNSQLSFGKKLAFPIVEPSWVAKMVIETLNKSAPGIRYLPRFWFWICLGLRVLPWKIYGKLKF